MTSNSMNHLDRVGRRTDPSAWSDRAPSGMVASAHFAATLAGRQILDAGGNAIDAAVATSLALAVCEPAGSGLGGMAMATVHLAAPGRNFVVEGACRAPAAATPERVRAAETRYRGFQAVAVPMHPAVLGHLHGRYGSLSREQVFAPAVRLAREGVSATPIQHRLLGAYAGALGSSPTAAPWFASDGGAVGVGSVVYQPTLAQTLENLADRGFEDLYRGESARILAADCVAGGGFLALDDLRAVGEPHELPPVQVTLDDWTVRTAGPPAGGWVLAQGLALANLLDDLDPARPKGMARIAKLIRRLRQDRTGVRLSVGMRELGGAAALLEADALDGAAEELGRGETTHLSVVDGAGNAVALTQSIERSFGAGVATDRLGFFLNGYLRAFKVEARRHPHFLRPGAIARSNAAPTIVFDEGRVQGVIGSTGSERMVSGILTTLLHLRAGRAPFEASVAPRLHAAPTGEVLYEARLGEGHREALTAAGFDSHQVVDDYAFKMGGLNLIWRAGKEWVGVGEPRRDGLAAGSAALPRA